MKRVILTAAPWLLLLSGPAGVLAQAPREVAARFAEAWEAQSEDIVEELLAQDGVRLRLEGDVHGGVGPKRVLAALQSYWSERTVAEVEVVTVSIMEGRAPRAYCELAWNGLNDMTGEPFGATIFLGLSQSNEGWRIDEIRTIAPS